MVGPTGSGKTALSIRLARHYGVPILSTDSRQFYRGLPCGRTGRVRHPKAAPSDTVSRRAEVRGVFIGGLRAGFLRLLLRGADDDLENFAAGRSGRFRGPFCGGL